MAGGSKRQSSSSSGIFYQGGDGLQPHQILVNNSSHLKGNSFNSISATAYSNLVGSSADMNCSLTGNSGPSVDASSLVTDANSALSGGPRLQRSASINTESFMRGLPASPLSFSSNTVSMDGSCVVQQSPYPDQNSQLGQQRQQGATSATSQPIRMAQMLGPRAPLSDQSYLSHVQKRARVDIKQEDVIHPQVMQQMLQRQDSIQLQGHNPLMQQALIQRQRLLQQQRHSQQPQQILQSMPQMQQVQLQEHIRQQQMRQLQQSLQPLTGMKRPLENGICARRIMQYIYHHRSHTENTIHYWRRFIAEYYAPRAKKRWCLSLYDNVGQHALGVFPQAAMDAWHCDICGSKSGRGFEATYEVLPRLLKIKFESGVTDELLFLDMPRECRLPSGLMMIEYGKAIQESVYEQLRVVREGQLRVIFTPELKIISWEFCARHHEEFFSRRMIVPQVNQLVQVAQKYQKVVTEGGPAGVSREDLQSNCNMFVSAGRQLAKNLDLQSLNDLGFSKRYIRSLQISEVVNSMKDLIDFSGGHKTGPIESLKSYPGHIAGSKLQIQKEGNENQGIIIQGQQNDHNSMNKVLAMRSGSSSHSLGNMNHAGSIPNVSLSTYQNMPRRNTMNLNPNVQQRQEAATSSFNSPSPGRSLQFQNPPSNPNSCLTGPHPVPQQVNSKSHLQQNNQQSSAQANMNLHQHALQQLVHEMANNIDGCGRLQNLHGEQTANGSVSLDAQNVVNESNEATDAGLQVKTVSNKSNSLKIATKLNPTAVANEEYTEKGSDSPTSLQLMELVQDISQEFAGSGLFNGDDEDMYGWKN